MSVKPAAVGAFVLGGLALAAIAVAVFGGMQWFTVTTRTIVYFPGSVAGLTVGAPVTFRGVKVGQVQSMTVLISASDLKPVIPVYLDFEAGQIAWSSGPGRADAGLTQAVAAGLRAQLASQSLVTGQLRVDLDFHPGTPAVLAATIDGVVEIPSIPSELQQLKEQVAEMNLPELAQAARQTLAGMQRVLDELAGRMGGLADSLQTTSAAATATLEATTASVGLIQADAARALASIDGLAAEGRTVLASTGRDLRTLLSTSGRVVARAEKLVDGVEDMLAPRAPLRGNLDAALRDLAASASSLRTLTRDLERNPAGTIFGRSPR